MSRNCDAGPVKSQLKQQLEQVTRQIQHLSSVIDHEGECHLADFEHIGDAYRKAESLAASFYLQCYLSAFTSHYEVLSISLQHLMDRRHGALIVIQRKDPLESLIHSGIPLGALVSYSLLEAIFYPGNPLHDGAILIKEDVIVSAANVLPLSSLVIHDKKIGTRHRAALGLTEKSDAVVLVVSEETGKASFAYKGALHPISHLEHTLLPETPTV
ncbi:sporulation-specific diadenylate cyclase CdaS [Paenibacillus sp. JX-17]|uniref:Diadenylate cyclase n=1 Tax=Paenibacillus lacisoli TaxID=3064525 RepID=A0ABT9C7H1_9BACL|nr:sporulation-specific diadenylate cyclase CdaS [Paenibacillus sp. JX-17]MDO7904840.1 sporulation-specific diadenylate cyclase CdaS [Paenibacillus sp. JX-17]